MTTRPRLHSWSSYTSKAQRSCDLLEARCPPQVYGFLIQAIYNHVSRTRSMVGVFRPDNQPNRQKFAKHFFPGFTIRCTNDHSFKDPTSGMEVLSP
jgi:hypothetical protein